MIKRINNSHLFSQPSLIIFAKGTNNSDHVCNSDCIHLKEESTLHLRRLEEE